MGGPNPTINLRQSESATVDGTGAATVTLRPDGPREVWYPDTVASRCNTDIAESSCRIYIGPKVADQYFVDATGAGSFGDSTDRVAGHRVGRSYDPAIIGVWAGADPGSTATLTVTGTKTVG
jgi:hypothetical protein